MRPVVIRKDTVNTEQAFVAHAERFDFLGVFSTKCGHRLAEYLWVISFYSLVGVDWDSSDLLIIRVFFLHTHLQTAIGLGHRLSRSGRHCWHIKERDVLWEIGWIVNRGGHKALCTGDRVLWGVEEQLDTVVTKSMSAANEDLREVLSGVVNCQAIWTVHSVWINKS